MAEHVQPASLSIFQSGNQLRKTHAGKLGAWFGKHKFTILVAVLVTILVGISINILEARWLWLLASAGAAAILYAVSEWPPATPAMYRRG
jgi:hypothetical protein